MKKTIAMSLVLFGTIFLAGCSQQPTSQARPATPVPAVQQPTIDQGQNIDQPTASCQNFPPPNFCPGGIDDIFVVGTRDNGCSIYDCRSKNTQHLYLKHFGNKESSIYIDCAKDSDCKLVQLGIACSGFGSININNNDIEIKKFINDEQELRVGVNFQCAGPIPTIENSLPKCEKNQCAFIKK